MKRITYRKLRKYKYQLLEDYETTIDLKKQAENSFIRLSDTGKIWLKKGYAWDGPTNPALDTKNFMRASLVHDALYQLIREGHLNRFADRKAADRVMRDINKEDGMWLVRRTYTYWAVRIFGWFVSGPDDTESKVHYAPR